MKVETVEQFKIMEYLKQNFNINCIEIKLIDRYSIEVTDSTGEKMIFFHKDGRILY